MFNVIFLFVSQFIKKCQGLVEHLNLIHGLSLKHGIPDLVVVIDSCDYSIVIQPIGDDNKY